MICGMKVFPISYTNQKVRFKASDDEAVLGYDDEISQARRRLIREHYNSYSMPNYNIYASQGRMDKYSFENLISSLKGKVNFFNKGSLHNSFEPNYTSIYDLGLHNLKRIEGTESYRGSSIIDDVDKLPELKKAGIERIVDLVGYKDIEDACKKNSVEYFAFPVKENFWDNAAFKSKTDIIQGENKIYEEMFGIGAKASDSLITNALNLWEVNKTNFIDKFIDFIKIMQKDKVYIGCEFGTYKTDNALMLNYFFNSKMNTKHTGITQFNKFYLAREVENLYNNLTELNKKQLGWSNEFDRNFIKKLKNLK